VIKNIVIGIVIKIKNIVIEVVIKMIVEVVKIFVIWKKVLTVTLLTHSLSHSHTLSFTHSLIHSFTHSLIHSFTHSLTHSLTGNISRRDSNDKSWIEASPINSNRDPLISPKQRVYSGNKGSKDRVLSGDRRSDQRVLSGNRPGTRRGPGDTYSLTHSLTHSLTYSLTHSGDDELPAINQLAIDIHEDETDRYRFDQQGLTVEEMV
jgi:hypothetical protein